MKVKKGMSQTLALIVAASVLMMTALTVIFLMQGSLGGIGQTSQLNACKSAVQAQCQASSGSSIDTPGPCLTEAADGSSEVRDDVEQWMGTTDYNVDVGSTECTP